MAQAGNEAEPVTGPGPLSFGWRLAIAVWVVGFAALVLYELGDFLVKAIRGMF